MNWDVKIRSRLDELRRRLLNLKILGGLWQTVGGLAGLLLLVSLLEWGFNFQPSVRTPIFSVVIIAAIAAISAWCLYPLLRYLFSPTPAPDLALRWGRSISGVNDRLLNAMQVYEGRHQENTSAELAELALTTIGEELEGTSYEGALDRTALRRSRNRFFWAAGFWILALAISQGSLADVLGRVLQPGRDFGPADPFALTLQNIPELVIRGEPFEIQVKGRVIQPIGGTLPQKVVFRVQEKGTDPADLEAEFDSWQSARLTIPNPQDDLQIWAFSGNVHSDTASVRVKARPFIKDLQVRWFPPAYSKLPSGTAAEKRGDVAALKGSRVRISVQADRDLKSADLLLISDNQPDKPEKRVMEVQRESASAEFILMESGHYNLVLEDLDGIQSAAPVDYNLWPIQDERPTIEMIYPPAEAELNESLIVPLKARARDDFAVSRIRLGYSLLKGGSPEKSSDSLQFSWDKLPFEALGDGNVLIDHLWDLNALNLLPGDEILYKLEVLDNDLVSGPKRAFSSLQRLRFPTLEEIFARMEEGQSDQIDNVQETLDRSNLLKEQLDALKEELKRNPDLNWEDRKKVEEILKKQEEMSRQVSEMSQQMDQMIQKMDENRLLSDETLQKFQELQQLMAEVTTPELMQAIQKLQEALKQQDPETLRRAVEEFSLNQEQFLERMEKTLNILKQLQMEMKLDELAKRAEALLEKQQQINEKLDRSAQEGSHPQEAKEEAQLQKEMEAFEREFQETQKMLADSPYNPKETMAEAEELLKENQFPQSMNQMSQELQEGAKKSAQQKGSDIQSGLAQLLEKMKTAKEQMVNSAKSELAEALKKISHDLLSLSYQQEDLLNTSGTLDKASPRFRSLAQEQQTLKNHLEKTAANLFKLSQKSFFITPQIGAAIDQAFRGMDQALTGYTARSAQSVSRQQQNAMGGLNQAVMEIGQSLDQMGSSSSSTGFSEMMEQLAKMAGQQGEINQGTMALIPGGTNPGGLTMEQQAAMSRLAAQQEALSQQLESFNEANKQVSQTMGRLGELGKEMQEVINDLKNRQVDERTLKRQEQILTRLLDAQRSVREREYRKERISRTAQGPYYKPSPDELELTMTPDETRARLLEALKEGYTRDYQQLIRDYFEALAREK